MNQEYLNSVRYDWTADTRKIKVNDSIPDFHCFHCGRFILNSSKLDAFCKLCHRAMSVSRFGPDHDYEYFVNGKQALAHRELLEPVDFDMEDKLKNAEKDNFKLANGKPVVTLSEEELNEAERIERLFRLADK